MRNLRLLALFGVLLLMTLSACTATELADLQSNVVDDSSSANLVEFTGVLEALDETSMTVQGQLLSLVPQSEIASGLAAGDIVKVEATLQDDGSLVVVEVSLLEDPQDLSSDDDSRHSDDEFEFTGEISAMEEGTWTIADQPVAILVSTEIHGEFVVGDIVKVHAYLAEDGTLTAREIEIGDPNDILDDNSISSSDDTDRFELTGSVEAISTGQWTIAGVVVSVDAATEIRDAITEGDWVKAEGRILEDGSLLAVEIRLEDLDSGDTPELEFVGVVGSIGADSWTVAGREVPVTTSTEIESGIQAGDLVKVHLQIAADGTATAREIEFYTFDDTGMDDSDDSDDDYFDDSSDDDDHDEIEDEYEDEQEDEHDENHD